MFLDFHLLGCYKRQKKQSHIYKNKKQKQIGQVICQLRAKTERKTKIVQEDGHRTKREK